MDRKTLRTLKSEAKLHNNDIKIKCWVLQKKTVTVDYEC